MAAREGLFVPFDGVQGASPADARLALGGLLTPKGPSTLDIRQGILYGPGAGSSEPGRVTGTGAWQYSVAACHLVGLRSAGAGPYVFSVEGGTLTPDVPAAPGSGSRWDLIWAQQRDFGNGDADSKAIVGVAPGVPGGAKPYADVPTGAVVLAEAEVKAGATSTSHANVTITPVARFTVPRGCAIPVRNQAERNELTGHPGLRVRRLDTGSTEEFHAGAWGQPPDIAAITGDMASGAWQPLTLATGWSESTGSFAAMARKQAGAMAWVRGRLTSAGSVPANTTIATLPAGLTPAISAQVEATTSSGRTSLQIQGTRNIVLMEAITGATHVFLAHAFPLV